MGREIQKKIFLVMTTSTVLLILYYNPDPHFIFLLKIFFKKRTFNLNGN